ncbi:hypothetical protein Ancab_039264, partial [Ancistrocladus abbreviatus]
MSKTMLSTPGARRPTTTGYRPNANRFTAGILRQVITFYVFNFPDLCSQERMWKIFKPLGRVIDIFIPRKLNRQGF